MAPRRKRARLPAPKAKKSEIIIPEKDYISSLPNDILVMILSCLSVKDAVVTSLLSRRWQNLWTYVRRLDFDASETLDRISVEPRVKVSERPKYINCVNRVLRKHRGPHLDSFKISFDLDKFSKAAIDNWVRFAIGKRVQCLELDLMENGEALRHPNSCYTLPHKQLTESRGASLRSVNSFHNQVQPCLATGLKSLEALSLKNVNVSDEAIYAFLSSCPNLKSISVHGSGDLKNLKITGFKLGLKHLEIAFCSGVESVEISNVNLVSFGYFGSRIEIIISNVPVLVEVAVAVGYAGLATNVYDQLCGHLDQLVCLTLDIYRPLEDMTFYALGSLTKLKQLTLKLGAWYDECLLDFASLISGCPNLRRFVIQLVWITPIKTRRRLREAPRSPHGSIETVEIAGYFGRRSDVEIVLYCIQNCVALKSITIDPRSQLMERASARKGTVEKEEAARKSAKRQLARKIPPGVKLNIL